MKKYALALAMICTTDPASAGGMLRYQGVQYNPNGDLYGIGGMPVSIPEFGHGDIPGHPCQSQTSVAPNKDSYAVIAEVWDTNDVIGTCKSRVISANRECANLATDPYNKVTYCKNNATIMRSEVIFPAVPGERRLYDAVMLRLLFWEPQDGAANKDFKLMEFKSRVMTIPKPMNACSIDLAGSTFNWGTIAAEEADGQSQSVQMSINCTFPGEVDVALMSGGSSIVSLGPNIDAALTANGVSGKTAVRVNGNESKVVELGAKLAVKGVLTGGAYHTIALVTVAPL